MLSTEVSASTSSSSSRSRSSADSTLTLPLELPLTALATYRVVPISKVNALAPRLVLRRERDLVAFSSAEQRRAGSSAVPMCISFAPPESAGGEPSTPVADGSGASAAAAFGGQLSPIPTPVRGQSGPFGSGGASSPHWHAGMRADSVSMTAPWPITFEAVIRLKERPATTSCIASIQDTSSDKRLAVMVGRDLNLMACTSSGTNNVQSSPLPLNKWVHVAVLISGSGSYSVAMYVDGKSKSLQQQGLRLPTLQAGPQKLFVGCFDECSDGSVKMPFHGDIAYVRLWNTVRNNTQLRDFAPASAIDRGTSSSATNKLEWCFKFSEKKPASTPVKPIGARSFKLFMLPKVAASKTGGWAPCFPQTSASSAASPSDPCMPSPPPKPSAPFEPPYCPEAALTTPAFYVPLRAVKDSGAGDEVRCARVHNAHCQHDHTKQRDAHLFCVLFLP